MARETVIEAVEDGVAVLTMNRPRQKNAFNVQMWLEMAAALSEAKASGEVRAVVVTGAGDAFSAGQDLGEMAQGSGGEGGGNPFGEFMKELIEFDKPLVAAVNGVGVGIGLTMLLYCDAVYMARGARIRTPFVNLGVVPEAASSYLLPASLGWQRAAEVLFDADWIDAERALELGIARRIFDEDELLPAALAKAKLWAGQPPEATRHTKRLLLATRNEAVLAARGREDEAFAVRIGSPENVAAIRDFFERRKG